MLILTILAFALDFQNFLFKVLSRTFLNFWLLGGLTVMWGCLALNIFIFLRNLRSFSLLWGILLVFLVDCCLGILLTFLVKGSFATVVKIYVGSFYTRFVGFDWVFLHIPRSDFCRDALLYSGSLTHRQYFLIMVVC